MSATKAEALAAVRAGAFHEQPDDGSEGRSIVHSTTPPPMMLGADWDLAGVEAFIEGATDLEWEPGHFSGHELWVRGADGRVRGFDVPRPDSQERDSDSIESPHAGGQP